MEYATDDERVEEIKKWWKENGNSVLFGVALGLSILFGWRWWGDYQLNQSTQASTLFTQLQASIKEEKPEQAEALSEQLTTKFSNKPYAVSAVMAIAKMKIDSKDIAGAKDYLQWAYDHAKGQETKLLAGIRLARVLFALGEVDQAHNIVSKAETGNFASSYAELRGDILAHRGEMTGALAAYQQAADTLPPKARVSQSLQFKIDDLSQAK